MKNPAAPEHAAATELDPLVESAVSLADNTNAVNAPVVASHPIVPEGTVNGAQATQTVQAEPRSQKPRPTAAQILRASRITTANEEFPGSFTYEIAATAESVALLKAKAEAFKIKFKKPPSS